MIYSVANNDRHPTTFSGGYELLKEERRQALSPPERTNPNLMPLEEIQLLEAVFQRRQFLDQVRLDGEGRVLSEEGNNELVENFDSEAVTHTVSEVAASEQHVRVLQDAILSSPNGLLDPVTVWWSGARWICIDGHHRVLAYRRLKLQGKTIPNAIAVNVQSGGIEAAIQAAIKLNSKDKLNMSRADKLEAAWLMVRMNSQVFTVSCISATAHVSKRTVDNMRASLKALNERFPRMPTSFVLSLKWAEALRQLKGQEEWTDDKGDKLAEEWSRRFAKTFGTKLATQPEITAKALALYSETLVSQLAEYWGPEPIDNVLSDF